MDEYESLGDVELDFIARVTWLYHQRDMTQVEIARILGVPRNRILRALAQANESGIVQIHFAHPFFNCLLVEKDLIERFGLRDAMVCPTPPEGMEIRDAVGQAAASYLQKHLKDGDTPGVAWGTT